MAHSHARIQETCGFEEEPHREEDRRKQERRLDRCLTVVARKKPFHQNTTRS